MSLVAVREPEAVEYEEHEGAVLAMLASRFPRRFDAGERRGLYHEAWASVIEKRASGERVEKLRAFLLKAAHGHAMKRLESDRARLVELEDRLLAELPAEDYSTEERVLIGDQARIAREVIDALGGRQRALFKLRWDLQLGAPEVRAALGLSEKQYKRLAEEGAAAIAKRVTELNDGTWTRRQRSLITACLVKVTLADGTTVAFASETQRAELRRLLDSDPAVAAIYADVQATLHHSAALLPLPTLVTDEATGGRLSEIAASIKAPVADLLGAGKQHAAAAYVRAGDPTPLVGARPGAIAATMASCLAVGGGTYCAVEGLPNRLGPPLGLEQRSEPDAQAKAKAPETPETAPPATSQPTSQPIPGPDPAPPPAPPPPPAPTPAPAPTASPSEQQFGIEQPPPAPTAPAPAAPSAGGDSGGTGQFGIER